MRKCISFLLIIFLLQSIWVCSYAETILVVTDEQYFTFDSGTITEYDPAGGLDVVIPAEIGGAAVTGIGDIAFCAKELASVIIPEGVTTIGIQAFCCNHLQSITIPGSLTSIGDCAFLQNELTNLTIPDSVTSIGIAAFSNNQLSSVTISESVTTIGENAFSDNQATSTDLTIRGYAGSAAHAYAVEYNHTFVDITPADDEADFTFDVETGTITGYTGNSTEVSIPAKIGGVSVTAIGEGAFQNKGLTSIRINHGAISIADFAFDSNALTSLSLPATVTAIGSGAFSNNHLKTVTIPASVTFMGANALAGHQPAPEDLIIRGAVGSEAEGYANDNLHTFADINYTFDFTTVTITQYTNLGNTEIIIPSSYGGVPVTAIGDNAFRDKNLMSITIPDSVTRIGDWAFYLNELEALAIPDNVLSIGQGAFANNNITVVTLGNSVEDIGNHAFSSNDIAAVTIPDSVLSIGDNAFYYNDLTSVTIPDNVTSLGTGAFSYNSRLTSASISSGLTLLPNSLFAGCKLSAVTIPESVTEIGNESFMGNRITSLVISDNVIHIGDSAFSSNQIATLTLGSGLATIGNGAFAANRSLHSLVIPDSVTRIGDRAFYNTILSNLQIGENVQGIGERAFYGTRLTEITIPMSVTVIGDDAFANTQSPLTIKGYAGTAGEAYATANGHTFWDMTPIPFFTFDAPTGTVTGYDPAGGSHVVIPAVINSVPVTRIGNFAFKGKNLTSVTIPDSVVSIGTSAFRDNCLSTVTIPDSVTLIGESAFSQNVLTGVTIPGHVATIESSAFSSNCLTGVTLGDGVETIGSNAFQNNNLTVLTIPSSVSSIGDNAFYGNQLVRVTIHDSVTTIGENALASNQSTSANLTVIGLKFSKAYSYALSHGHSFLNLTPVQYFTFDSVDGMITDYDAAGGPDVVIPDSIAGVTVKGIGHTAFSNKGLTSVTMLDNLVTIGDEAFAANALTEVTIPQSVNAIGIDAFDGNQEVPASLTIRGYTSSAAHNYATANNHTFVNTAPSPMPEAYFDFDPDTQTITGYHPGGGVSTDLVIPSSFAGVTAVHLGTGVFNGKNLTSAIIPDSVTCIGERAFDTNDLVEITLPDEVTSIGDAAFRSNRMKSITIPNNVMTIGNSAFWSNALQKVDIPASVTTIGDEAFKFNHLQSLFIPSGVTTIGKSAFSENNLKSVTISDSVTNIGEDAFAGNQTTSAKLMIRGYPGTAAESYATDYNHTFIDLSQATTTILAEGSLGAAADRKIAWLTSGTSYQVIVNETTHYVKSNGTLSDQEADVSPLVGTEITGLTNGVIYKVEVYTPQGVWYTVTFDSQGGSAVDSQSVLNNNPAAEPPAPVRQGFSFAGWYRDPNCITGWSFETGITGNITLYAGWKLSIGTGGKQGQSQLGDGTTEVQLNDNTLLDLQAGRQTVNGNQVVLGGQVRNMDNYSGGSLSNEDLTQPRNIGGQNVQVKQAVRLESGVDGQPVTITNAGNANIFVSIPDSTTIMAGNGWDGTLMPPKTVSAAGTAPSGFSIGNTVIEVGSPTGILLFDKPVILELKGVTGPVGYKRAGSNTWVRITQTAGGTYDNPVAPAFPGEAYISNGIDTKIITWHFTSFAGLTVVPPNPVGGSGGGSGGSSLPVPKTSVSKERIYGEDRYQTAVAISHKGWQKADHVILVCGETYADALTGVTLSGLKDAPVLLTGKNRLNANTLQEIKRLGAQTVYLIGGTGVIAENVERELIDNYTVERIEGSDRFRTAVTVGQKVKLLQNFDTVILATGLDFADAMAIAPFAAKAGTPILYTAKDSLNEYTEKALRDWGIKKAVIAGGTGAVSSEVQEYLEDRLGIQVTRLSGTDRYLTSLAIARHYEADYHYRKILLATGESFADALAGAPLAAKDRCPVILTGRNSISQNILNYIQSLQPESITILGGTGAVSDEVKKSLP